MSDTGPAIDSILESIRARMAGDVPVAEPVIVMPPPAPVPPAPQIADDSAMVALMRSFVEPQLKAWLDANMPEIVERIAQAEIRRLTGQA